MSGSQLPFTIFDLRFTRCIGLRSFSFVLPLQPECFADRVNVRWVFGTHLTRRQVEPEIDVNRSHGNALEHGGGHAYELVANFFSAERPHKPSERRYVSFMRHRSSGVAAMLRA